MEPASDDEGDTAAAAAPRLLLFVTFVLFCFQPSSRPRGPEPPAVPLLASVRREAPKPPPAKPRKPKKKIYLTFDDGPNRGTRNVLDIVADEGVPVSFFLVGEHVFDSRGQRALFDSLKACPHVELCNHSYSHAHHRYTAYYAAPDSVVADFRRTHDSLDLASLVARTPGRNIWRIDSLRATDLKGSTAAADSLQRAGFALMGWDAEWHFDHKTYNVVQSAETMLRQIDSVFAGGRTKRPGHLVLLAHDQAYSASADSLELRKFLQELKKKEDYELLFATEYPGAVPGADSLLVKK
ncbi:polysaccharide deacetylase family protein [Flaviaesturariibacter amylovorans]|uniref:NodB homology domain-containing protein n=1 Tax=Flaviaesturariibacter amylovorans TaxID=1084520 RepID=A0ABP8HMW0_9BACT